MSFLHVLLPQFSEFGRLFGHNFEFGRWWPWICPWPLFWSHLMQGKFLLVMFWFTCREHPVTVDQQEARVTQVQAAPWDLEDILVHLWVFFSLFLLTNYRCINMIDYVCFRDQVEKMETQVALYVHFLCSACFFWELHYTHGVVLSSTDEQWMFFLTSLFVVTGSTWTSRPPWTSCKCLILINLESSVVHKHSFYSCSEHLFITCQFSPLRMLMSSSPPVIKNVIIFLYIFKFVTIMHLEVDHEYVLCLFSTYRV